MPGTRCPASSGQSLPGRTNHSFSRDTCARCWISGRGRSDSSRWLRGGRRAGPSSRTTE